MTSVPSRSLAFVVAVVALVGCKKEGGDATDLPAEMRPHPAQGDPSRLAVPALFASVPADTPYLIASVEAAPPELWGKMKQAFKPMIDLAASSWRQQRGKNEVLDAILGELDGKWSAAGIESLGFSATPSFAMYGLGLQPFVVRMAIKDGKAVRATIERIAAKAGKQLPPPSTRGGVSYWQHADDDGTAAVVSIGDRELIAAVGKAEDIDARLGLILGLDKPARSMADGALIKQLMARHGFGGQLIGFADTRQLAGKAIEAAGGPASPACTAELDRLSARLPRLVVGYSELSGSKIAGGFVVELAPELVAELRALRTEVPGLGAALRGHPLFAFAVGLDLARAQQLGVAAAGSLRQLGTACGLGPLVDSAADMARGMSRPLPEPVGRISGGVMVVNDVAFGPAGAMRGMPENIDGLVLIASPDARALFDQAGAMNPTIKGLGITADGKLHDLHVPLPVPLALAAGVGDRLIVVTAGDQGRQAGDKLVGARAGARAPLFAMTYDVGKGMELASKLTGADPGADIPELGAFIASLKGVMGRVAGTIDVTDHGLAWWSSIELR
jgi:hypothetical protein